MDRELPQKASKLYAMGEMNGWRVKVVWADGPFTLGSKVYQESLTLRFNKKGRNPCAAVFLDEKWDAGVLAGYPGVLRTQKNFTAYLNGDLDIDAEHDRIYPYNEALDTPKKNEYVLVGKIKLSLEEFHRQCKPYVQRVVPDWVKNKRS